MWWVAWLPRKGSNHKQSCVLIFIPSDLDHFLMSSVLHLWTDCDLYSLVHLIMFVLATIVTIHRSFSWKWQTKICENENEMFSLRACKPDFEGCPKIATFFRSKCSIDQLSPWWHSTFVPNKNQILRFDFYLAIWLINWTLWYEKKFHFRDTLVYM